MSIAYDPYSNSIRVEHTKEEFLKLLAGRLGGPIWAAINDDIACRISFRHEHAHFISYLATGLSELHSIVQDWKLTLLLMTIKEAIHSNIVTVPIVRDKPNLELSKEKMECIGKAWNQALSIEGYLFGFGTRQSTGQLFHFGIVDELISTFDSGAIRANSSRFRKLLKQVMFTTPPHLVNDPEASMVKVKLAQRSGRVVSLPSRAVLEAYAITIEVIAEYVKTVITSLNRVRDSPKRLPHPIYTVAIEAILDYICPDRHIDIKSYLLGRAGPDVYWAVALTSYAAMQVPVVEDPQGETIFMGSLKQLNPAFRLGHILENMESGIVQNPIETYQNRKDSTRLLTWLNHCHSSIGDPWSIKFYQHIGSIVEGMSDVFRSGTSMNALSWKARYNFLQSPCEMIGDGGIWAEAMPCDVRFFRTADDHIFCDELDSKTATAQYISASAIHILQAMVFGDSWDSCWDKVSGFDTLGKIDAMKVAFGFYLTQVGYDKTELPSIALASGYQ